MLRTREQGAARPETGHARRFARVAVSSTLAVGLIGAGTIATTAAAAPASAATHKTIHKVKATDHLRVPDKSFKRGTTHKVSVTSKAHGKATRGKVYFWVSGHRVRIATLKHGKATYHLSKHLHLGHHRVRATIHPSSNTVKRATTYTKVHVYRYSSRVVAKAVKYTGVHYRYGGTTPHGFDCSGFTQYVYSHEHVKSLPRTSSAQRHAGHVVSKRHAKSGDLVYTPGHVAIYVGGDKIIDAPRPGKSIHVRKMWHTSWTYIHVSHKANTI
jgi:cell wall-associated NlpC family hydrolase